MNTWLKTGLQIAALSGGIFAIGAGIASAETPTAPPAGTSSQHGVIGSVKQLISAPIDITRNSISVLGGANSPGPHAAPAAKALVSAPVKVTGNSVAVAGKTTSNGASAAPSSIRKSVVSAPVNVTGNSVAVAGKPTSNR